MQRLLTSGQSLLAICLTRQGTSECALFSIMGSGAAAAAAEGASEPEAASSSCAAWRIEDLAARVLRSGAPVLSPEDLVQIVADQQARCFGCVDSSPPLSQRRSVQVAGVLLGGSGLLRASGKTQFGARSLIASINGALQEASPPPLSWQRRFDIATRSMLPVWLW